MVILVWSSFLTVMAASPFSVLGDGTGDTLGSLVMMSDSKWHIEV
jgi:hypothetical protein